MVNALSAYIPHFLALSASSPYWMGQDTGLASTRSKVFEGLPTAGPPWQLSGWAQFERFMDTLIAARTIATIREVWWDIRPHPGFGTVELRICDGLPTLREVAVVAALSQCLVHRFDMLLDRGYTLPIPKAWVVRENKWRAARHGIEGSIIVDDEGTTVPTRDAIAELVEELSPIARRLGCHAEVQDALAILERGPSYLRQREVVAGGGSLRDVVDSLVAELRNEDGPLPRRASLRRRTWTLNPRRSAGRSRTGRPAPGRRSRRYDRPTVNVIFVEPAFPPNQREFVRALAAVGGDGHRGRRALARPARRGAAGMDAALPPGGQRHRRRDHDRRRSMGAGTALGRPPRSGGRGPHPDRRAGARELHHPGHLGAHRVAVQRQALDEGGAACRGRPHRGVDRRAHRGRGPRLRGHGRLPADPQAARRGWGLRDRPRRQRRRARRRAGRLRQRRIHRRRGVRRGPRGLLRHPLDQRGAGVRLRHALLPQRARCDAHTLDQPAVRRHQPRRHRARLRRGPRDGAARRQRAGDRDVADAHGVVLRAQGTALQ